MVTYAKISPKSGEPQRYSWGSQKKKKKNQLDLRSIIKKIVLLMISVAEQTLNDL